MTIVDIWIVGKINPENYEAWEFQGVFDDEKLAVDSCKNETYFVGPAQLNKVLPEKTEEWSDAFYPRSEQ